MAIEITEGVAPPLRGGFILLKRIPRVSPWAIIPASRWEARLSWPTQRACRTRFWNKDCSSDCPGLPRRPVRSFRTCAWAENAPQRCCRVIDTIYSMRRGHIIHCKRAAVFPDTACYRMSQKRDMGHPAGKSILGETLRSCICSTLCIE